MRRNPIKSINRKLHELIGQAIPTSLQIEITNHCNFQCVMCPFHCPGNRATRPKGFMSLEQYTHVLSEFKNLGGSHVIPQGAGESFAHPEIWKILEMTKKDFGLSVGLNTNGSFFKETDLQRIIDLGISDLGFSIDALSEEVFQKITGSKGLAKIEESLEKLVSFRKQSQGKIPFLRVLIVEQDTNSHEIDSYIKRWVNIVDEVVVQTRRLHSGRKLTNPRKESRKPCRHLFDTIFVQWDGDVVICCEDWDSEFVIGNVYKDSLEKIWRCSDVNQFRVLQKKHDFSEPKICRGCEAWAGGVPVRSIKDGIILESTELTRVFRRVE